MTVTTNVDFASAMQAQATATTIAVAPKLPSCEFALACQAQSAIPAYTVPRCHERAYAMQQMKHVTAADYAQAMRTQAAMTTYAPAAPVSDFASACVAQAHIRSAMPLCQERAMYAREVRASVVPAPIAPQQRSIESLMPATSICNERAMYAAEAKEARKLMRAYATSTTPNQAAIETLASNVCSERSMYTQEIKELHQLMRECRAAVKTAELTTTAPTTTNICNERASFSAGIKRISQQQQHSHDFALGCQAQSSARATSARVSPCLERAHAHQQLKSARDSNTTVQHIGTAADFAFAMRTHASVTLCGERFVFGSANNVRNGDFAHALQAQGSIINNNDRGIHLCLERAHAHQQAKAPNTNTTTADYAQALHAHASITAATIASLRPVPVPTASDFAAACVEMSRLSPPTSLCLERAYARQELKTLQVSAGGEIDASRASDFACAMSAQAEMMLLPVRICGEKSVVLSADDKARVAKETMVAPAAAAVPAPAAVAMAAVDIPEIIVTVAEEIAQQRRRSSIMQALRRLSIAANSQLPCAISSSATGRAHRLSVGPMLAI